MLFDFPTSIYNSVLDIFDYTSESFLLNIINTTKGNELKQTIQSIHKRHSAAHSLLNKVS